MLVASSYIDAQLYILKYMSVMTVTAARSALPQLIDRVQADEAVTLTRHGLPVAVLVRPDYLARRRASSMWADVDCISERLLQVRGEPIRVGLSDKQADRLVKEIRMERDAQ